MRYYEVQQINATGNGYTTTLALVIEPKFEGMGIHATQVGELDENIMSTQPMYRHIEPVDFMVIGNATCVERKHPFSDVKRNHSLSDMVE